MVEVVLMMLLPLGIFGVFALLALRLGAESRPWFDERPVLDDRPNWFPIVRTLPRDEDVDDEDGPDDGMPVPVAAPVVRDQRPAVATRPAMSPSGV